MNALTPQFLNDEDGNAMYAVLPIAQYNELLSRAMEEETDFYYELTDEEIDQLQSVADVVAIIKDKK